MSIVIESRDWVGASVDHVIERTQELRDWVHQKQVSGYRIYHSPVMDMSDYGMHYCYRFEEPSIATEFKLRFQCMD